MIQVRLSLNLIWQVRLSLNLLALPLEQVVSKRRKMLMDMGDGMSLEIKEELKDEALRAHGAHLLKTALAVGPFDQTPAWYNDDQNFSRAVNQARRIRYIQSITEQTDINPVRLPYVRHPRS